MPNGVDIRAQIDTETAKGLFVINGGGALALLSLLVAILDKDGYERFALSSDDRYLDFNGRSGFRSPS